MKISILPAVTNAWLLSTQPLAQNQHDIKKSFFDDLQKQNDDIFFYY